jgi:hypothetical protein
MYEKTDALVKYAESDSEVCFGSMIASGLNTFIGAIDNNANLKALAAEVRASASGERVREHINRLLDEKVDMRYMNERCPVIGGLLLVLKRVDRPTALKAAEDVMKKGINLHWSRQIASEMTEDEAEPENSARRHFGGGKYLLLGGDDGRFEVIWLKSKHSDDQWQEILDIVAARGGEEKFASIRTMEANNCWKMDKGVIDKEIAKRW